jgi:hypothetical protein
MIYNLPRKSAKFEETWVLKNHFVDNCALAKTDIMFTSNGKSFSSITCGADFMALMGVLYDSTQVADLNISMDSGWDVIWKGGYQTVTFLEPPTGDLLKWLQANAVKQ